MSKLNYSQIKKALTELDNFKGSSMSGQRIEVPTMVKLGDMGAVFSLEAGDYIVKSYATVIAIRFCDTGTVKITDETWGVTTARHLNLCRACL